MTFRPYGSLWKGSLLFGALPSASWVFSFLRGVVLGWPGGPVPFLKIAFPKKRVLHYHDCRIYLTVVRRAGGDDMTGPISNRHLAREIETDILSFCFELLFLV